MLLISVLSTLVLPATILSLSSPNVISNKPLKGRFLHITDLHPDPMYKSKSNIEEGVCHRKIKNLESSANLENSSVVKGKGKGGAGYWGEPDSVCDSPLRLVDATFNWLYKYLTSPDSTAGDKEIDFVIWTGDSSRHDLDPELPRTLKEIYELNRYVASKMKEFVDNGIVVVPCFGNNDVFPHNTMYRAPSSLTKEFSEIWKDFIPPTQMSNFQNGGYFSVEAIQDKLLLISLNTMYMYDANKVVKGCPAFDPKLKSRKNKIDPGTEELDWLEDQLNEARKLGLQVYLVGHVAPTLDNWYEECYVNYGEIVLRYHDTILGQVFGHTNTDHFTYYHTDDIYLSPSHSSSKKSSPDSTSLSLSNSSPIKSYTMEADLKANYLKIPREENRDMGDYSIININPSIIPTYLPALRIWQYNITEVEGGGWKQGDDSDEEGDENDDGDRSNATLFSRILSLSPTFAFQQILSNIIPSSILPDFISPISINLKKGKKRQKKKKPHLPRHSSPNSPSQTNTFLTPLGYTQFILNLNSVNKNSGYGKGSKGRKLFLERGEKGVRPEPEFEIEYSTFVPEKLANELLGLSTQSSGLPNSLIPVEIKEIINSINENQSAEEKVDDVVGVLEDLEILPYEMEDLTVQSWLNLARGLSRSKKDWKAYTKRMTMGV